MDGGRALNAQGRISSLRSLASDRAGSVGCDPGSVGCDPGNLMTNVHMYPQRDFNKTGLIIHFRF